MDEMKPGWYLNVETREQTYWDGSQWSQIPAPISVPTQTQSQRKQTGAPLATAAIWVGGIATAFLFVLLGFHTVFSHSFDHHGRDRGFGYHRSFDGQGYGFYNGGGSIIVPGMNTQPAQPAPATP